MQPFVEFTNQAQHGQQQQQQQQQKAPTAMAGFTDAERARIAEIEGSVDGVEFPIPFQNMKVDVPILSVKKYVRNGFGIHFTEDGGYMECKSNGRRFYFIESDGCYWIKIKAAPPSDNVPPKASGFARHGQP